MCVMAGAVLYDTLSRSRNMAHDTISHSVGLCSLSAVSQQMENPSGVGTCLALDHVPGSQSCMLQPA